MNSSTTRIMKEARALFWPWCLVMIAGASTRLISFLKLDPFLAQPLASPGLLGFWVGIPLLATLSLGNEFQHRTFSLLLSQPADRMRIWREKWIVTMIAILAAAPVYYVGFRAALREDAELGMFVTVWSAAVICAAGFWTLVARSTIGGLILNVGALLAGIGIAQVLALAFSRGRLSPSGELTLFSILSIAGLGYAGAMLWLGWRKLARFQATGIAGDDLLVAGPNVIPDVLGRAFRCSPNGATLNLIRKELRLLRPLWLLTLLAILFMLCLTPFRATPIITGSPASGSPGIALFVIIIYMFVAMPLAGSLSLSEERTTGTHAWHMTLPVSIRIQWLVKLGMTILISFASLALVVIAARLLFGSTFGVILNTAFEGHPILGLLGVSCLSFPTFWSACAVNGAMRATLLAFPAASVVVSAGALGFTLGENLRDTQLLDFVAARLHTFPPSYNINVVLFDIVFGRGLMWVLVPAVIFAVFQSYRLFRRETQDSILSMVRSLLPIVIIAFLGGVLSQVPKVVVFRSTLQIWSVNHEIEVTIAKMQLDVSKLDPAHPLQFTLEDLTKVSPPSEIAKHWLVGSSFEVGPQTTNLDWLRVHPRHAEYIITTHFGNGWDCKNYGGVWNNCRSVDGSQFGNVSPP